MWRKVFGSIEIPELFMYFDYTELHALNGTSYRLLKVCELMHNLHQA